MLIGLIFLAGGGSRSDIASLAPLRFVATLAVATALLYLGRQDYSRISVPLALLGALALIALAQLIPLPSEIWGALPEREAVANIDALVGLELWRPITLSPVKTANSLASLVVPLAALSWWALARDTDKVLLGFVAVGVLGALWGILQLFADPQSGLYFYEITNRGSATGFFANRNHHSVYLSCCVLISLYLVAQQHGRVSDWLRWTLIGASILMALAIIANISRAGLITLFLVMAMSVAAFTIKRIGSRSLSRRLSLARLLAGPVVLAAVAALVLALFFLAERSPALSRLFATDQGADLRTLIFPELLQMVLQFQPWGTGMGAFEYAFRMREPYDFLGPAYVNQAHNDWLQFQIEGGIAAIVLTLIAAVFALLRTVRIARAAVAREPSGEAWLGLGLLVIVGTASMVDYPLRVPSIMTLSIIALAMFAHPALSTDRRETGTQ